MPMPRHPADRSRPSRTVPPPAVPPAPPAVAMLHSWPRDLVRAPAGSQGVPHRPRRLGCGRHGQSRVRLVVGLAAAPGPPPARQRRLPVARGNGPPRRSRELPVRPAPVSTGRPCAHVRARPSATCREGGRPAPDRRLPGRLPGRGVAWPAAEAGWLRRQTGTRCAHRAGQPPRPHRPPQLLLRPPPCFFRGPVSPWAGRATGRLPPRVGLAGGSARSPAAGVWTACQSLPPTDRRGRRMGTRRVANGPRTPGCASHRSRRTEPQVRSRGRDATWDGPSCRSDQVNPCRTR